MMITLLREGIIYSPQYLGKKDILIAGHKIEVIGEPGEIKIEGAEIKEIDVSDKYIIPGFIDSHVHILGGGGEGGPATRAPEIKVEDIISSGVTSVLGCLGTDATTRHMESLLAKAKGLEEEGVTTYIFTGSYQIPVVTITQDVCSDLTLIDKVIGAGEIAISDHRSSQPSFEEFARLAAQCRVGGMLGGKAGILHCHLGDGPRKLEMLFRLSKETEIPPTQVIPTHVNRNKELLKDALEWVRQGGYIDITAPTDPHSSGNLEIPLSEVIRLSKENNVPLSRITVSSDSNGSLPVFNEKGQLTGLTVATEKSLLKNFCFLLQNNILSLEEVIPLFSTNPAKFYKLSSKGEIKTGKDADIIILDQKYNLTHSVAKGQIMMASGEIIATGRFNL